MKLEFVVTEGGETLAFLPLIQPSQATQEKGLSDWADVLAWISFRAAYFEIFCCQVMGHLVAMDNPWYRRR